MALLAGRRDPGGQAGRSASAGRWRQQSAPPAPGAARPTRPASAAAFAAAARLALPQMGWQGRGAARLLGGPPTSHGGGVPLLALALPAAAGRYLVASSLLVLVLSRQRLPEAGQLQAEGALSPAERGGGQAALGV